MATQATTTGEQATGKRRGRPSKAAIAAKVAAAAPTEGRGSDFEKAVKSQSKDTIVKAFASLRKKLFKEGQPVDQITRQLQQRISDLQSKSNVVH